MQSAQMITCGHFKYYYNNKRCRLEITKSLLYADFSELFSFWRKSFSSDNLLNENKFRRSTIFGKFMTENCSVDELFLWSIGFIEIIADYWELYSIDIIPGTIIISHLIEKIWGSASLLNREASLESKISKN